MPWIVQLICIFGLNVCVCLCLYVFSCLFFCVSFGSSSKASSIVELNCIFGLYACVCVSVCMPSGVYSSVRHVVLPLSVMDCRA